MFIARGIDGCTLAVTASSTSAGRETQACLVHLLLAVACAGVPASSASAGACRHYCLLRNQMTPKTQRPVWLFSTDRQNSILLSGCVSHRLRRCTSTIENFLFRQGVLQPAPCIHRSRPRFGQTAKYWTETFACEQKSSNDEKAAPARNFPPHTNAVQY